jgi:hypothetical protein
MTIENQDFSIYTGNHADLEAIITNEETGIAKNLLGFTIEWNLIDKDGLGVLVTKTTTSGIVITSNAGGLFTVSLLPSDTANLVATKNYRHQAIATDSSGNITTVFVGKVTVKLTA